MTKKEAVYAYKNFRSVKVVINGIELKGFVFGFHAFYNFNHKKIEFSVDIREQRKNYRTDYHVSIENCELTDLTDEDFKKLNQFDLRWTIYEF